MNKRLLFIIFPLLFSCQLTTELYLVKEGDKWGYINRKGRLIVAPVYENCCYERYEDSCCSRIIWPDALGIIKKDGKYGAINHAGETKIAPGYEFLDQYHNSLLIARSGNKYGVLNENCDTIFPFIFDNQFISCNNVWGQGQINGSFYLLNFGQKTKKKVPFDKVSYFVEGFAAVKKSGKFGFIDTLGNVVIDIVYQNVWPFNKGLAAVKQNYQWGFIDTSGKFVIPPQFDETEGFDLFSGEFAIVVKNGKYGVIDRQGHASIPPGYDYLFFEDKNILLASINKGGKQTIGLIDLNEKWLYISANKRFDYFNGYIKIERNNKFGLIKLKGDKIIVPPVFDEIAFRTKGLTLLTYCSESNGELQYAYVNKRGKMVWKEKGLDWQKLMEQHPFVTLVK